MKNVAAKPVRFRLTGPDSCGIQALLPKSNRQLIRAYRDCMKSNHASVFESVSLSFLRVQICTVLACSSCFLFAQDAQSDVAVDAEISASADGAASDAAASAQPEDATAVRANIADLVNPPPSVATVPAYVPGVVAGYLPARDTNAAIGIPYPSGSSHFVYLMAGIRPPGGDPRLAALETPARTAVVVTEPAVIYSPAEIGSKAVMVRGDGDVTHLLPPGAFVRGGISSPAGRASAPERGGRVPLYYRQATTTETGEDLVWNFPPGSSVIRSAPASTGQ
jgi:hypothetical protein